MPSAQGEIRATKHPNRTRHHLPPCHHHHIPHHRPTEHPIVSCEHQICELRRRTCCRRLDRPNRTRRMTHFGRDGSEMRIWRVYQFIWNWVSDTIGGRSCSGRHSIIIPSASTKHGMRSLRLTYKDFQMGRIDSQCSPSPVVLIKHMNMVLVGITLG